MEFFEYLFTVPFLTRALIVGTLVSLVSAVLGIILVLKRYSTIGDGLSHVAFGALGIATALNLAPMAVTVPVVVVTAFLLLRLGSNSKFGGEKAVALISVCSLAAGVIAVSLRSGQNAEIYNYLFGSVLSMNKSDVVLSVILALISLLLFILFYNRIFAVTFDENFLKAGGVKTELYNMLIAIMTALTIVLGMRLMGSMLISALIIFPALSSMRLWKRFRSVVISSVVISVLCFTVGLFLSFQWNLPTGASIVAANAFVFAVFSVIKAVK